MDKYFMISERGSTVRKEIVGGLTTFFAMVYIVFVNPLQIAAGGANGWLVELGADSAAMGKIWNSVFVASILAAFLGTILYALYAKLPYAQACGMGLNSFFCTCFVSGAFFTGVDVVKGYQAGIVIIFLSGVIFMVLSFTGARSYIAKAMPDCLKKAIPAGIGLFIALIGFKNAGIIEANQFTFVQFVDIKSSEWVEYAPAIAALLGFIIICVLSKLNVRGNVLIGILASTVLYYLFMGQVPSFDNSNNISQVFSDFGEIGVSALFHPDSWSNAFFGENIDGIFGAIVLVIVFCLVDMFDTIGTLYGTATEAKMLDKNGDPTDIEKAMVCDSVATLSGSVLGTSTCTTFVESSAGVAAGARTGLASLVTSICFLLCLFISPIASIIPGAAAAPALIYVGVLMLKNFANVDMSDIRYAAPAFLTLIMMPLTYSIANGIGIGAIAYVLITLFTGKFKKSDIMVTIIAALFVCKFIFVTM